MRHTVEQIADEALSLPGEARALLADRLVESLDLLEDGYIRQLWASEARARRDDVRNGLVKTVPGQEALDRVRKSVSRCCSSQVGRKSGFIAPSAECWHSADNAGKMTPAHPPYARYYSGCQENWELRFIAAVNVLFSRLLKRQTVGRCLKRIFADALPASFLMQCFTRLKLIKE
jgi:hypothetical protein